jgi:hypothetical protein
LTWTRVDEHDRVDAIKRPRLPRGHLLDDRLGDPADRLLRDLGAIDVGQVRADLAGRQSLRSKRDHQLVDAGQPALPLPNDLRIERTLTVPRHFDLDRADIGQHRLRPRTVPGVARAVAL